MTVWQHLRRMGGPGLVVLGLADNSIVPLTGSMDVLRRYGHDWRGAGRLHYL